MPSMSALPEKHAHRTERITQAERLKRQRAVASAHSHNYIEGIEQDPAADPIFDAYIEGAEIDMTELGKRIDALAVSR